MLFCVTNFIDRKTYIVKLNRFLDPLSLCLFVSQQRKMDEDNMLKLNYSGDSEDSGDTGSNESSKEHTSKRILEYFDNEIEKLTLQQPSTSQSNLCEKILGVVRLNAHIINENGFICGNCFANIYTEYCSDDSTRKEPHICKIQKPQAKKRTASEIEKVAMKRKKTAHEEEKQRMENAEREKKRRLKITSSLADLFNLIPKEQMANLSPKKRETIAEKIQVAVKYIKTLKDKIDMDSATKTTE